MERSHMEDQRRPELHPAMSASTPDGVRCPDCTVDGEPCPTCYEAWWSWNHPDVKYVGRKDSATKTTACESCGRPLVGGACDPCDKDRAEGEAFVRRHGMPDGMHDPVNHPSHYTAPPSGIECITVTRHMGFNLGNAVKYVWRADLKGNDVQDLEKAVWYLNDEIAKRRGEAK